MINTITTLTAEIAKESNPKLVRELALQRKALIVAKINN